MVRARLEQELRDAYDKLNNSVKVLGRHNSEITLLAEMNTMLQASFTIDEAHQVIGQYLPRLYPDDSGVFYVFNSSRNLAETIVTWGKNVPEEPNFTPEECWAVRLGRPYLSKNTPDARAGCNHGKNISGVLFCVPMISQNEVSGVLALVFNPAEPGPQGHPVGDTVAISEIAEILCPLDVTSGLGFKPGEPVEFFVEAYSVLGGSDKPCDCTLDRLIVRHPDSQPIKLVVPAEDLAHIDWIA